MNRDDLVPEIRAIHDAADDCARALVLITVPSLTLAKFAPVFDGACERAGFEIGRRYIAARIAVLRAPRSPNADASLDLVEEERAAFCAIHWCLSPERLPS